MSRQLLAQLRPQPRAHLRRAFDELLTLHDPEYAVGNRTGDGVRAVGVEHEIGLAALHLFNQLSAYGAHAHGQIAAGETLAANQDIRNHVPMIDRKTPTRTAKARHHLIGDEQDVVLGADLSKTR